MSLSYQTCSGLGDGARLPGLVPAPSPGGSLGLLLLCSGPVVLGYTRSQAVRSYPAPQPLDQARPCWCSRHLPQSGLSLPSLRSSRGITPAPPRADEDRACCSPSVPSPFPSVGSRLPLRPRTDAPCVINVFFVFSPNASVFTAAHGRQRVLPDQEGLCRSIKASPQKLTQWFGKALACFLCSEDRCSFQKFPGLCSKSGPAALGQTNCALSASVRRPPAFWVTACWLRSGRLEPLFCALRSRLPSVRGQPVGHFTGVLSAPFLPHSRWLIWV